MLYEYQNNLIVQNVIILNNEPVLGSVLSVATMSAL